MEDQEKFLLSSNIDDFNDELQDKIGELNSVSFSRARKRRESAAIFNRLNEDTSINLLNDPFELRTFEEEDAFEFHLPKEITMHETEVKCISTPVEKVTEVTCSNRDSAASISSRTSQNDDMNASLKYLSNSSTKNNSENIREIPNNIYPFLNGEYQQNAQAMNNTLINEIKQSTSTPNQDLTLTDNANESLLIEQRARATLNQFKEMMSKFKMLNVDAKPPPVKSVLKSELKANLSHIKCPDDVVCLVNHLLYSPIGIHRTHPTQEMKIREQPGFDVNDSPLRKHAINDFEQSRLFPRYEEQELLTQKNEMTNDTMDFQESVPLGGISKKSIINKGKILGCESKFSLDSLTHFQRPRNNSNYKETTSQTSYKLVLSNNEKQRNLKSNNELSIGSLGERNEFRKRKRTAVKNPLSPHLSFTTDSNKTQAKSSISPAVKKLKIQPSNLRVPTSISRLKYNANQRKIGFTGVSLNSSNMDDLNLQLRLPRQISNSKQRK